MFEFYIGCLIQLEASHLWEAPLYRYQTIKKGSSFTHDFESNGTPSSQNNSVKSSLNQGQHKWWWVKKLCFLHYFTKRAPISSSPGHLTGSKYLDLLKVLFETIVKVYHPIVNQIQSDQVIRFNLERTHFFLFLKFTINNHLKICINPYMHQLWAVFHNGYRSYETKLGCKITAMFLCHLTIILAFSVFRKKKKKNVTQTLNLTDRRNLKWEKSGSLIITISMLRLRSNILIRWADSYKLTYIIIYYFQSLLVFTVLVKIGLEMSKISLKWHVATGKVLSTYSEI